MKNAKKTRGSGGGETEENEEREILQFLENKIIVG